MGRTARGVAAILCGLLLSVALFGYSDLSSVACDFRGVYGLLYELTDIYLPRAGNLRVDWAHLAVTFYDGCNVSAIFVGVPLVLAGLVGYGIATLLASAARERSS